MPRIETSTPHAHKPRNSRVEVTTKDNSPFAHRKGYVRRAAAEVKMAKRRRELVALRALANECTDYNERKHLAVRISAAEANMRSWADYIAKNYPQVAGAVIRP